MKREGLGVNRCSTVCLPCGCSDPEACRQQRQRVLIGCMWRTRRDALFSGGEPQVKPHCPELLRVRVMGFPSSPLKVLARPDERARSLGTRPEIRWLGWHDDRGQQRRGRICSGCRLLSFAKRSGTSSLVSGRQPPPPAWGPLVSRAGMRQGSTHPSLPPPARKPRYCYLTLPVCWYEAREVTW